MNATTANVVRIANAEYEEIADRCDEWNIEVVEYDQEEPPIPDDEWNRMENAVDFALTYWEGNVYVPQRGDAWMKVRRDGRTFIRIDWFACCQFADGRNEPGDLIETDEFFIFELV